MKKLIVLPAITLALMGLLVFTACPDPTDADKEDGNAETLAALITKAYDAKYGVKVAGNASEVATGLFWVTKAEMDAFNAAISEGEAAEANPLNQSDTAKANLKAATATFKAAKKPGSAAAITLSGTVTVKNNGQAVPYAEIFAHNEDWTWEEKVRISASEENAKWSITTKAFSTPTEIFFRVGGFANNTFDTPLFYTTVKDLTKMVHNQNISNIEINMGNLRTITLSGTISANYDGKPVPSVVIQAFSSEGFLGETTVLAVGSNTSWSIKMEALDSDTEIRFGIWGFDGPSAWNDEQLFQLWDQDFGVTVKDKSISNIVLDLGDIEDYYGDL
jgi:hypothetical protein